jgi:pilin isopeptide linkage protein
MKRRMNKRMAAATLAGAMVLSMNGMAWAEVTEFNLTKEVTTDGNTHAPNTTFRFTITEGDASTFEGAVVSAGVKDGLTLDTANNFSFAPGDKVLASYTKTGKIKVDATKFTEPGVYHYLVTETQDTYDGITYDVTPRHVYVYVVNGTDGYEVEAVKVVKDGDTAKEDNLKIVNSYGDGSTPNDDIHDFIIKKTVTGNQGHKNKPFSFTVTIDGDDADKEGAEKYMAVKTPKTGEAETIHITDGLTQTFTLMDGETLHIYGLSEKDKYTVTETDYSADGYTTTVKEDNAEGFLTADGITVEFINRKDVGPATGVAMTFAPYVLLVAAAGGLGAVVLGKKKREDDEI